MKLLISPSKTMQKTEKQEKTPHLFKAPKEELLSMLQAMDLHALKNYLEVSDQLAKANHKRYQDFCECYRAVEAYTGAQYKALDYQTLATEAKSHLNKHLLIMSGLYGFLRPSDAIAHYRLPMGLKYKNQGLHLFWKNQYATLDFDEPIVNLASKEYSDALPPHWQVVDIKFDGASSMQMKQLRGLFVRRFAEKQIETLDALKRLTVDGYYYDATLSTQNHYIFIKK